MNSVFTMHLRNEWETKRKIISICVLVDWWNLTEQIEDIRWGFSIRPEGHSVDLKGHFDN